MTFVTDEILMAYSDGELSAEECRDLEAMLAEDPELRRRLGPFAMTGAPLADVFAQPMREPVPERLVALIRNKSMNSEAYAHAAHSRGLGRGLAARLFDAIESTLFPNGLQMNGLQMGGAAAALVVAVGAAGWMLRDTESGNRFLVSKSGMLVAAGELAVALEQKVSGEEQIADGASTRIFPMQTFRDHAQRFCREYEMSVSGNRSAGVACRTAQADWHVAFHGDKAPQLKPGLAERGPDAVATAVAALKNGSVLSTEAEQAAIDGSWPTKSK